ncbi:heme-binding protein [Streptomyces rubiginosohelvolus]|uniref:heme-binding protein n=1 Tax=Streptomyces rubiginosohelvolus TaxID=67362 RepID=UPI0037AE13F6
MTISTESVSLEDARRVVAAGEVKADEIGSPSNIAVVDVGGNLVAHNPHGRGLDRKRRHLHQQGFHVPGLRHQHRRPGRQRGAG